jgi:hypothetical protein
VAADEDRDASAAPAWGSCAPRRSGSAAVERRLVLVPDRAKGVDALVGAGAALVRVDAEAATSSRIQPTPTPRKRRPPERRSIVAHRLASWSGWCSGSTRIRCPGGAGRLGGEPRQQVERVGQLAVLRQGHPTGVAVRVAALVAHRHRDVLDREERLEARLVGVLRERRIQSGSLATPSRYGGSSPARSPRLPSG